MASNMSASGQKVMKKYQYGISVSQVAALALSADRSVQGVQYNMPAQPRNTKTLW